MNADEICPSCKSTICGLPLSSHVDRDIKYRLYQCLSCDLQFWNPRQTDSSYYYEKSIIISNFGLHRLGIWHYPFFDNFPRRSGRLLDVGCADGAFLAALKEKDFDVHGCDFDHAAVESGIKNRGLENLSSSSLNDFAKKNQQFDAITFFEVLEHQDFPEVFMSDIKKILGNNGWIAGSVPNRDRLIIKREPQDYPPGHFIYFSEESLRNFLEIHGFRNIMVHSGDFRVIDLGLYLETQLLNSWGAWLKKAIKKKTAGIDDAAASVVSVNNLPKTGLSATILLKTVKGLRDMIFFPPALLLKPVLRPHLYFQAQLLREP